MHALRPLPQSIECVCTCRSKTSLLTEASASCVCAQHATDPRLTICEQQLGLLPQPAIVRPAITQQDHHCR